MQSTNWLAWHLSLGKYCIACDHYGLIKLLCMGTTFVRARFRPFITSWITDQKIIRANKHVGRD